MADGQFLLIFPLITVKYLVFLALFAHKLLNIGGIYSPTSFTVRHKGDLLDAPDTPSPTALDMPTDKDSYRDVWTYLKMALLIRESVPN